MYKVGDVIGLNTIEGVDLLEITDIYTMMSKEICLSFRLLMNDKLEPPVSNVTGCIVLPQQENEIITKEQYFQIVQEEINLKQGILNGLKEQYK